MGIEAGGRPVALITGGTRGIGRVISETLAQDGYDLALNFFRNRKPAEETKADLQERYGVRVALLKAHVGNREAVTTLFDEFDGVFQRLDVCVSNAASGVLRPVTEIEESHWDWTQNSNLKGFLFIAQGAARRMPDGGSIVALSSLGASRVLPHYAAVGVSKAGIEALTRYLAVELASRNIAVNAVSAGAVDTDALRHFPNRDELLEAGGSNPAGRMVTPEDVAQTVRFLCSPGARMIRGQTIVVDGGLSLLVR